MSASATKIFVSCGQRTEQERKIAEALQAKLRSLAYETYVAIEEQTTEALADNIFRNLSTSEYFLFIDFRREKVAGDDGGTFYRGSLFSNQELALAKFLRLEILPFREKEVKSEGIVPFIQLNPTIFDDREELVEIVVNKVRNQWKTGWKNELALERSRTPYVEAIHIPLRKRGRWYHVTVKNRHYRRLAQHCTAYLEKVIKLESGEDLSPGQLVESKWRDVTSVSVMIPPQKSRDLDAFYFFEDEPQIIYPSINPFIADSTEVLFKIRGPGKFELTYVVFSDDFAPARETFVLEIDGDARKTRFYKKGEPPGPSVTIAVAQPSLVSVPTSGSQLILNSVGGTISLVVGKELGTDTD